MNKNQSVMKALIQRNKVSERELSERIGLSRTTLRKTYELSENVSVQTLEKVTEHFGRELLLATYPKDHRPENSVLATSFKVKIDGENSWKIHLMDMVDEFRKTLDIRLLLLPPTSAGEMKITALLAATTLALCEEAQAEFPDWAIQAKSLKDPWFVSGMESLKASAILESPLAFRCKNIFVHQNFLERV